MINYLTIISLLLILATIVFASMSLPRGGSVALRISELAGRWVSMDGYIRQELFADGHYAETLGNNEFARSGKFQVCGNSITYVDENGNTVSGNFSKNMLYHNGHILYRETAV